MQNTQLATVGHLLVEELSVDLDCSSRLVIVLCRTRDDLVNERLNSVKNIILINQSTTSPKLAQFTKSIVLSMTNVERPIKVRNYCVPYSSDKKRLQKSLFKDFGEKRVHDAMLIGTHDNQLKSGLRNLLASTDKLDTIYCMLCEMDKRGRNYRILIYFTENDKQLMCDFGGIERLKNLQLYFVDGTKQSLLKLDTAIGDVMPDYIILPMVDNYLIKRFEQFKQRQFGYALTVFTFAYEKSLEEELISLQTKYETDRNGKLVTRIQDSTNSNKNDNFTRIVFDLETTGCRKNCDIVEIACWVVSDLPDQYTSAFEHRDDVFYSLILPTKRMNPGASKVNGIKKAGKRNLMVRGKKHFNVRYANQVFEDFVRWIGQFKNPVLIGHNGFKFDAPILISSLIRYNLFTQFRAKVTHFGDTLGELKRALPDGVRRKLTMLGEQFIPGWQKYKANAHSALFDVWATIKVMKAANAEYNSNNFKTTNTLIPAGIMVKDDEGLVNLVNVGILSVDDVQKLNNVAISSDMLEVASNESQAELEKLLESVLSLSRMEFLSKITRLRAYMLM